MMQPSPWVLPPACPNRPTAHRGPPHAEWAAAPRPNPRWWVGVAPWRLWWASPSPAAVPRLLVMWCTTSCSSPWRVARDVCMPHQVGWVVI